MDARSKPDHSRCVADRVPQGAIDAAVRAAANPTHDDGHADCFYAGILLAAWPHLALADSQAEVDRLQRAVAFDEQEATDA